MSQLLLTTSASPETHAAVSSPHLPVGLSYVWYDASSSMERSSAHTSGTREDHHITVTSYASLKSPTVCSTADSGQQRIQQSFALLDFVRGAHRSPVDYPHKGPLMRYAFLTSSSTYSEKMVATFLLTYLQFFSCDQAALWMVFSVRLSVCPSVCPSVRLSVCHTFLTMFPSSYHHEIFRSYHIGPG